MKTILHTYLASLLGLWLTSYLIKGFRITGGVENYFLAAAFLGFIYLFIRPILRLLFFPINLLTLGLLSWVVNVVILYLLNLLIPQISVSSWHFNGFNYKGFLIPAFNFNQILTFIICALTISFIVNFFSWLCRK